ncbi:hypothetical protein GCM10023222_38160 [Saccharopolyspora cebuensis]
MTALAAVSAQDCSQSDLRGGAGGGTSAVFSLREPFLMYQTRTRRHGCPREKTAENPQRCKLTASPHAAPPHSERTPQPRSWPETSEAAVSSTSAGTTACGRSR